MHLLGFWHEQMRPDRDDTIEIITANISPEKLVRISRTLKTDPRGRICPRESFSRYRNDSFKNIRTLYYVCDCSYHTTTRISTRYLFFMRERPRVPSISTIWSPIVCVQIRFIDWLGLIRRTQRRLFTGEKYLVYGKLFCSV